GGELVVRSVRTRCARARDQERAQGGGPSGGEHLGTERSFRTRRNCPNSRSVARAQRIFGGKKDPRPRSRHIARARGSARTGQKHSGFGMRIPSASRRHGGLQLGRRGRGAARVPVGGGAAGTGSIEGAAGGISSIAFGGGAGTACGAG